MTDRRARFWPCIGALVLASALQNQGCSDTTPDGAPEATTLTAQQYLQAGVPDWNRAWSATDMTQAASALATLARKDLSQLPRYQDERSGALFARITARETLDSSCPRGTSPQQISAPCVGLCEATTSIFRLYTFQQSRPGEPSGSVDEAPEASERTSELIELWGAMLRCFSTELRRAEVAAASLDPADPRHAGTMSDLATVRKSLENIIAIQLAGLREPSRFKAGEPERLVGHMLDTFPEFFPHLPPESRDYLLGLIRAMATDPGKGDLRPRLALLQERIESGLGRAVMTPGADIGATASDPGTPATTRP